MHKRSLRKPDGRSLQLYARQPIEGPIDAPSPNPIAHAPNPHLRWHPLRGEWVAYATHRQNRTFLPPPDYNPLATSTSLEHPTELPAGPWDIAVFDNLFPTFAITAHDPATLSVPTVPARGVCEVVVFTQDPAASLGTLPPWHVELLLEVWADRYRELGALPMSNMSTRSKTAASKSEQRSIIRTDRSTRIRSYPRKPLARSVFNERTTSNTGAGWSKTWWPAKSRNSVAPFIRVRM